VQHTADAIGRKSTEFAKGAGVQSKKLADNVSGKGKKAGNALSDGVTKLRNSFSKLFD
jgi:hypothetical protein